MDKFLRMFSFYRPLSFLFDTDPNSDPNNPNPGGGDDDGSKGGKGGDGGGAKKEGDEGKKQPAEDSYELTVDGEKRRVTIEEMKTLAQKASGAEKRFEEANKIKKEAADAVRFLDLVERMKDPNHVPTELEVKELAGMLGADSNEFMAKLQDGDGTPPAGSGKGGIKLSKEDLKEALGFDPDEARVSLEYSKQQQINAARDYIMGETKKAVDKDEIFGKMKIGEGGDDRLQVINDLVAEDVLRKIQDGSKFGAELVAASVQKIRAHLTRFGIPNKPEQYPIALGLGPGQTLPSEVLSDKPITRVGALEEGAEENFVKRYSQKGIQMMRSLMNNKK